MGLRRLIAAGVVAATPAWAISDDANPWLAIENATCVAHRTVDYAELVGVPVEFGITEWTSAADGLPTHCYLAGLVGVEAFQLRMPMAWNGTLSLGDCATIDSTAALNQGSATAFGQVSAMTGVLLSAVSARHYDAPLTSQVWATCP